MNMRAGARMGIGLQHGQHNSASDLLRVAYKQWKVTRIGNSIIARRHRGNTADWQYCHLANTFIFGDIYTMWTVGYMSGCVHGATFPR